MSSAAISGSRRPTGTGLALVGYRATGKSTVGRIVAERLGRRFADADQELESRLGRTIASLFANEGETAFRDAEEEVIRELTAQTGLILATGGGAILRSENRRRLQSLGMVLWLKAPVEVLAQRLRQDATAQRPSLTSAGLVEEIGHVLAVREPIYQEVSDLDIETSGLSPARVATQILSNWQSWLALPIEASR